MSKKGEVLKLVLDFIGKEKSLHVNSDKSATVYLTDVLSAYFSLDRKSFHRAVYRMMDADYIRLKRSTHGIKVVLSNKGTQAYKNLSLDKISLKCPKEWDKKWRILCFDIPEKFKRARRSISFKLQDMGFYRLQDSVYVYPFECRTEIESVFSFFSAGEFVSIIEATHFDGESKVKKHFNLK